MAKQSLLEQAKGIKAGKPGNKKIDQEEIELAMAWMNDEVTLTAIMQVKNLNSGSVYVFLARAIKQWYLDGGK